MDESDDFPSEMSYANAAVRALSTTSSAITLLSLPWSWLGLATRNAMGNAGWPDHLCSHAAVSNSALVRKYLKAAFLDRTLLLGEIKYARLAALLCPDYSRVASQLSALQAKGLTHIVCIRAPNEARFLRQNFPEHFT